ncbi:MAG: DUF1329 domain-containing protein [Proteobacteria bacterium]|nr:DUF1329 domain-containing protein [Pseudomonadota bacterium]
MKRMKILKCFGLSLCTLFILLLYGGTVKALDLPKVIDKTNCNQYKDLLIPAMYRAVERGDFVVTPGNINFEYKLPIRFIAASEKNEGKFDVNHAGELISKSTGKFPKNIYSFPFPNIDFKDPKAGLEIIYNFKFTVDRFMASRDKIRIMWINNTGEERYLTGLDSRLYMVGRPPGQEIRNPDMVEQYEFQRVLEPMSTRGTNTMAIIYIGAKEDSNYAYVPAIRRIRQTGSTTRSDPYMGSDSWMDMNYMWGGKTSSMKWKYVGEKTILVGFTSPDMLPAKELPDGRMIRPYPYTGTHLKFGYEDPNWKGASWAPLNITYVPRKVWIVEQMPKDPYYNWGKHLNYVDQETYTIWYKEVWEKSGDFRTWVVNLLHYSESPSGNNNAVDFDCQLYIDEKYRHATSVNRSADPEQFLYMPASKLDASYFSVNNFLMLSK